MEPRYLKDERGQASLFMALFISTMIVLFAFTTNVGMLVHAKINLQNAADAAAYAGAAVQARQLTSVGYLNWEMRRALKEFLYFYQIRSQYAAMPCFPRDSNGNRLGICPQRSGDERYDFAFYDPRESDNETNGPFLPSVCVIFDPDNNYCQKSSVPGIPEFRGGGSWGVADPIVAAVRNATNQIIDKKVADCRSRTAVNQQFLVAWLFNLYPLQTDTAIISVGQDSADPFPATDGLDRVGILPRMALLRARIDNYEEALNLNLATEGVGSATISAATLDVIKNSAKGLDYFERPVQAYLSAKNNLPAVGAENGIFNDVELSELVPSQSPGVETSTDQKNPPILAKFNDVYANASFANSKFEEMNSGDRGNCHQSRELRVIPRFPLGITKDPRVLTYYAVRLQAKVRLLFSPFGGDGVVTLSAYSAAKPFGSRIGKDINLDPNHLALARGKTHRLDPMTDGFTPRFPNVLVSDDDQDSEVQGFSRNSHLGYIRGAMIATQRADYGPRLAGAYAPWEVGFYTVPANFQTPESIGLFEDNPSYSGKYFSLAAPILPVNDASAGLSFLRYKVASFLTDDGVSDKATLDGRFREIMEGQQSDGMWSALFSYLESNGEVEYHKIPDPLLNDEPNLLAYVKANGQRFTVAAMSQPQRRQLTSWNNQKTATDSDPALGIPENSELGVDIGRSGYSVRFISFQTLQSGGQGSNDPGHGGMRWENPFSRLDTGSSDASERIGDDLRKLQH
jgi:hypothetical protein